MKPIPKTDLIALDTDCRKCLVCKKRSTASRSVEKIQHGVEWEAFEDDAGEKHYHYPGYSLKLFTCDCLNTWMVRTEYVCWCGWNAP